jgi:hypothetical protein
MSHIRKSYKLYKKNQVRTCIQIKNCGTIKANVLRNANIAKQYWSVRSLRFNYPESNEVSILIKSATLSASRPAVLNLGYMDGFQEDHELGWGEKNTLFSITCNWNLAFLSAKNVRNKVTYGLYTPKTFAKFNKSHHLNFMHLNTFPWEGVRRLHWALKEVRGTRKVKNPSSTPW